MTLCGRFPENFKQIEAILSMLWPKKDKRRHLRCLQLVMFSTPELYICELRLKIRATEIAHFQVIRKENV